MARLSIEDCGKQTIDKTLGPWAVVIYGLNFIIMENVNIFKRDIYNSILSPSLHTCTVTFLAIAITADHLVTPAACFHKHLLMLLTRRFQIRPRRRLKFLNRYNLMNIFKVVVVLLQNNKTRIDQYTLSIPLL